MVLLLAFLVSFLSGLLGIGGGIIALVSAKIALDALSPLLSLLLGH